MRALLLAVLLAGCGGDADAGNARPPMAQDYAGPAGAPARLFPDPAREVASIVTDTWSNADSREQTGEVAAVLATAGITRGQVVADIGAGSGYYTPKLAAAVGPQGHVYAQDVEAAYVDRLRGRVGAEGLTNVTVSLGQSGDPRLPVNALDRALLVHMYHEIAQPYALMWNLWGSLKPGGLVVIVDTMRATQNHGTPPRLLECELRAVGYVPSGRRMLDADTYVALFAKAAARPAPASIKACRG